MREERIEALLKQGNCDYIYICSPENLLYYSGFSGGEGVLILGADCRRLFTDSRYTVQAEAEAPDFEVVDIAKERATAYLAQKGAVVIGYEGDVVSARVFETMKTAVPKGSWQDLFDLPLEQRAVKAEEELSRTRQAAALADRAFAHVLPFLKPGVEERDIAMELEWYMRKNGASGPSFEIICASGYRSAMPHGTASRKELTKGELVTLDFGCFFEGYASDMTRTVVLGKADEMQKKIYQTVLSAQEAALSVICSGKSCREIDAAAREIIQQAGYGDCFGHGLGHGTGLAIHERPTLSPKSMGLLREKMCVTVEPGIYVRDFGGVRIEDLVIVTKDGYENLTNSEKSLLEL